MEDAAASNLDAHIALKKQGIGEGVQEAATSAAGIPAMPGASRPAARAGGDMLT